MELHNTLSQMAGKYLVEVVVVVELSWFEESETVDYLSYVVVVEAAEVQVALTGCCQSHKDCSLPVDSGTVVVVVVLD